MRQPISASLFLMLFLGGCATSPQDAARDQYEAADQRYKLCLGQNADYRACDGERIAFEVEQRKYADFCAGVQGGCRAPMVPVPFR
jgi:hypothetical protein